MTEQTKPRFVEALKQARNNIDESWGITTPKAIADELADVLPQHGLDVVGDVEGVYNWAQGIMGAIGAPDLKHKVTDEEVAVARSIIRTKRQMKSG